MQLTKLSWRYPEEQIATSLTVASGSANIADLVRVLQASGAAEVSIERQGDRWIRLTPELQADLERLSRAEREPE